MSLLAYSLILEYLWKNERPTTLFFVDLFQSTARNYEPLASRMRPRTLAEYVGQDHILAPGRLLRRSIEADKLTSVIFSGPPGTGKTTLARVIAQATRGMFLSVSAVLSGVKDIRELIEKAKDVRQLQGRKTILFVDEVHRWNKAQQDALLPWVENGTFVLIGATTENPFFEVNAALVSRSRIFQLLALGEPELLTIARQAVADPVRGYGLFTVTWEPGALEHLVKMASGDARSLLNALELAVESSVTPFPPPPGTVVPISLVVAEESIQKRAVIYDKDGDYHFDSISAFIKSLRGSDPDASLYWLARMVRAGEDPDYLLRRMLILASEDVGLAEPAALGVVNAASEAFRKVGMPEGQYHLAQAALYLATCPKSNSTSGYFDALKSLETEGDGAVPSSLKDGSRDGAALGHGKNYLYPHSFEGHWVNQQYLPSELGAKVFYRPGDLGYEGQLKVGVVARRELLLSLEADTEPENLTWSQPLRSSWLRRLDQADAGPLADLVAEVFRLASILRHDRVWIAADPKGLFVSQALLLAPEGGVWVSCRDEQAAKELSRRFADLPELQKPVFEGVGWGTLSETNRFEVMLAWGISTVLGNLNQQEVGRRVVVEPDLADGVSLVAWLDRVSLGEEVFQRLHGLERDFLGQSTPAKLLQEKNFELHRFTSNKKRTLKAKEWEGWWTPGRPGSWPEFVLARAPELLPHLRVISSQCPSGSLDWRLSWVIGVKETTPS